MSTDPDPTNEHSPAARQLARRAVGLPAEVLWAECEVEFVLTRGPGGQHRNKAETGVRLRHPPTGVVVTATERRSQAQNRTVALGRLRQALAALCHVPKRRRPTRPTRSSKRRRLSDKRHQKDKKTSRRPDSW